MYSNDFRIQANKLNLTKNTNKLIAMTKYGDLENQKDACATIQELFSNILVYRQKMQISEVKDAISMAIVSMIAVAVL